MGRILLSSEILASVPAVALADCPRAADLASGVTFEMPLGASWSIRSLAGEDREVRFAWSSDDPTQTLYLHRGIYLTGIETDGHPLGTDVGYGSPLAEAPDPSPGATWDVEIVDTVGAGGTPLQLRYGWGAVAQVQVGECAYAALPLTLVTTTFDGALLRAQYQYFPEFGAVVIVSDGFGSTWPMIKVTRQ